jgi:hypothetical protein
MREIAERYGSVRHSAEVLIERKKHATAPSELKMIEVLEREVKASYEEIEASTKRPPKASDEVVWATAETLVTFPEWMGGLVIRAYCLLDILLTSSLPNREIMDLEREMVLFLVHTRETLVFPEHLIKGLLKGIEDKYNLIASNNKTAIVEHPDGMNKADREKMDREITRKLYALNPTGR